MSLRLFPFSLNPLAAPSLGDLEIPITFIGDFNYLQSYLMTLIY